MEIKGRRETEGRGEIKLGRERMERRENAEERQKGRVEIKWRRD